MMTSEEIQYLREYYKLPEDCPDHWIVDNLEGSLGLTFSRIHEAKANFKEVLGETFKLRRN